MSEILKKIKYKLKIFPADFLLKFSLFANSPMLTAAALWLSAGQVNAAGETVVLCLGRSIFLDDLAAMAKFNGRIKYVVIYRHYFWRILNHFCDKKEFRKVSEENYHTNDLCREGKIKYHAYLKKTLPVLQKLIGFKAVMSCNFGYIEQQELAKVCEENEVPFIVLNKEGIVIPSAYDEFVQEFKSRRFIGAKMLCYNNLIKKALLDLKLPGLTEDKMEVVGVPRLDRYFLEKEYNPKNQKQITLFSFFPSDKFRYLKLSSEWIMEIDKISEQFHKLFIDFAFRRPDFQVIIKTKVAKHYLKYVSKMVGENSGNDTMNLVITNNADSTGLVKDSMAVAGFNSTTLIEAIIAGKTILSPDFSQILKDQAWDYFEGYGELVNYVRDMNDLEKYILNAEKHIVQNTDKKKVFLERFIFTPDGRASQRAEREIIKVINERKKVLNSN